MLRAPLRRGLLFCAATHDAGGIEIDRAGAADLDGMLDLIARNQPERGGTLSANFSRERLSEIVAAMPVIVARRAGTVVGALLAYAPRGEQDPPIIRAMLTAYPGGPDSYVYGPVVVDENERGQGIAQAMFAELRRRLPGREGILLIRRDNEPSLRAHRKMGMREVASFTFNARDHIVLAYVG
jgi:predicted GNAT superfamily acetyltransferase